MTVFSALLRRIGAARGLALPLCAALSCLALPLCAAAAAQAEPAASSAGQEPAAAAEGGQAAAPSAGPSGLPLPRFVTLKSGHVNMRIGPDMDKYPVIWSYRRRGLPVEIIQEYGNWRRIRDVSGATGWVNAALLSGKRGAIIEPGKEKKEGKNAGFAALYAEPSEQSRVVIKAEPGVIGAVENCSGTWCALNIEGNRGYIKQEKLWGVYRGEIFR